MYDIEWLIYQNFCQSQNSAKVPDNFQALMCDFIEESKKIWQSYGQKTLSIWHSDITIVHIEYLMYKNMSIAPKQCYF